MFKGSLGFGPWAFRVLEGFLEQKAVMSELAAMKRRAASCHWSTRDGDFGIRAP